MPNPPSSAPEALDWKSGSAQGYIRRARGVRLSRVRPRSLSVAGPQADGYGGRLTGKLAGPRSCGAVLLHIAPSAPGAKPYRRLRSGCGRLPGSAGRRLPLQSGCRQVAKDPASATTGTTASEAANRLVDTGKRSRAAVPRRRRPKHAEDHNLCDGEELSGP